MSKEIRIECMQAPEHAVTSILDGMIYEDTRQHNFTSDMYNGDYSEFVVGKCVAKYEGHTSKQLERNLVKLEEIAYENAELEVLNYAILGRAGYIAYSLKPSFDMTSRTGYRIRTNRRESELLKTQAQVKHYLADLTAVQWYGAKICDGNDNIVGKVDCEEHVYKKRPQKKPAKYQYLDHQVIVAIIPKVLVD